MRIAALASALLATACGADAVSHAPEGVGARVSDSAATVVNVRWTTAEPSTGYVSYGKTSSLGLTTPLETASATGHSQALLELSAGSLYYYRVITWDGHDAGASPVQTFRTGALPAALPTFAQAGDSTSSDGFDQLTLLPISSDQTSVSAVAPTGEVLWYHTEDSDRTVTRAVLSVDGKSVVYNALGAGAGADSELVRAPLDGSSVDSISVPGLGRDFLEKPDGTFAALAADVRDFAGAPLRGDQIVEIDASGTTTSIWSTWDCFDPQESPGDGPDGEWTGAVALALDKGKLPSDPSDDAYYVSLRNISAIARVERATGRCTWVLGSAAKTLDFADAASAFEHPAGFFAQGTKLAVLDADGAGSGSSRVVEYTLDVEANTAMSTLTYAPAPALHVDELGAVTLLTNHRRLANWSTNGRLEVVDDDGNVLWSLAAGTGVTLGYHTLIDSLYSEAAGTP